MIAGAWVVMTGAAITLSWYGVDTVLRGTVYDPPRALPVSGSPSGADRLPEPDASSTQRPPPDQPDQPDQPSASGEENGAPDATADPPDSEESPVASPSSSAGDGDTGPETAEGGLGSVETVRTDGGRAAFDMGETGAELVSATPEPGWTMRVWTEDTWIRVVFTSGGREVSVFCLWHDSAPRIELYER
jgi:hypothetical protein